MKSALAAHPFHAAATVWQVRVRTPLEAVNAVETVLEAMLEQPPLALTAFEDDTSGLIHADMPLSGGGQAKDPAYGWEHDALPTRTHWWVEALYEAPPEAAALQAALAAVPSAEPLTSTVQPLPARDWLSEVMASFPPQRIGRFYVHGSHHTSAPPPATVPLRINAGQAFGSGEHPTTRGCLLALEALAKRRPHAARLLDVGCGSGILAVAMALLWRTPVLATDIDPASVRATRQAAAANRVSRWLRPLRSNGYAAPAIRRQGPYDIITANILARPLIAFAPALAAHLAPGGHAVLSGLLTAQAPAVLHAHRLHGLHLRQHLTLEGWSTLVLGRGGRGDERIG